MQRSDASPTGDRGKRPACRSPAFGIQKLGRSALLCYPRRVIHRAFRYRLYPTREQDALMVQTAGARRFIYNLALEQRRDWWRQAKANGVSLNYVSQNRQVTELRRECVWLA